VTPRPWDWGLGGVIFLEDSPSLGLGEAPIALGLGVFWVAKGVRVFAGLGELLVPLRLRGSDVWGAALVASGIGGFSVPRVSSPF
jgi:hypothetical protein